MEFGIHWYAATVNGVLDEVLRVLTVAMLGEVGGEFRDCWEFVPRGANGYRSAAVGPGGVRLMYSAGRDDLHFVITGVGCEMAGTGRLLRLMREIRQSPRRVDLAFDGIKGPDGLDLNPEYVWKLVRWAPEDVRTRAKIRVDQGVERMKRTRSIEFLENGQGRTCYIGSPNSVKRARVYDRRGLTRFELQLRHEAAQDFVECAYGLPDKRVPITAMGFIRDFIEFLRPNHGQDNKYRAGPVAWWSEFCAGAERVTLSRELLSRTLAEKAQYLRKQHGPCIAELVRQVQKASVDKGTGEVMAEDEARAIVIALLADDVPVTATVKKIRATAKDGLTGEDIAFAKGGSRERKKAKAVV